MENFGIILPQAANYQLPDDSLLNFYEDIENRTFWINDEINIYSLNLIHYILKWNREDKGLAPFARKPIKLLIFSPGGDLDIYRTISDVVQMSKTPIIGINLGIAYSAASMIFLACHERYMLKSSSLLFHCGSSSMSGGFSEMSAAMDKYRKDIAELSEIIAGRSSYTQEEIAKNMRSDWYINAEEAFAHEICTKIIDDVDDII